MMILCVTEEFDEDELPMDDDDGPPPPDDEDDLPPEEDDEFDEGLPAEDEFGILKICVP